MLTNSSPVSVIGYQPLGALLVLIGLTVILPIAFVVCAGYVLIKESAVDGDKRS